MKVMEKMLPVFKIRNNIMTFWNGGMRMTKHIRSRQSSHGIWDRLGKELARLLAVFLCLSLFCAFLPMTVWAEETEEDFSIPETEDIAQEVVAAPEGSAVIIENVVIQPAVSATDSGSEAGSDSGVTDSGVTDSGVTDSGVTDSISDSGDPAPVDSEQPPEAAGTEVNQLEDLLVGDETPEDLTYVNDFPVVVQTQVYDNTGVVNKSMQSPYVENQGGTSQNPETVSGLFEVKPGALPISNDIVIKGSTETITPPEEVQAELAMTPFTELQRNDNNTVQNTTDDTYVRTRETTSDNAINKAIQDALNRATSDSAYITIQVAAGEYDGDIVVNANDKDLQDGFKIITF